MPHFTIDYDSESVTGTTAQLTALFSEIKRGLRAMGIQFLEVDDWPLTAESFGFSFRPSGPFDELTDDFRVSISAHADEDKFVRRIQNNRPDDFGRRLAQVVIAAVSRSYLKGRGLSAIGLPGYGTLGYGRAVDDKAA